MSLQGVIDSQTIKRANGEIMREKSVYADDPHATTGFCLYLNARFEVDRQGDIWIERPDTLRPIKPGRPVERNGDYQRITLEIRKDLLAKIDASGKSRREYIEQLVQD